MRKFKKKFIVLHHSLTPRDQTTFTAVDNYHKQKWNFISSLGHYCGYHYFIDANGVTTQARADWEVGAHCKERSKNMDGIGICMAGNFDEEQPTGSQVASLKTLITKLSSLHKISPQNLRFHRDFAKHKTCPGKNIANDFLSKLVA
jgi:N-acetylmuramoyl-L-alanine amidase